MFQCLSRNRIARLGLTDLGARLMRHTRPAIASHPCGVAMGACLALAALSTDAFAQEAQDPGASPEAVALTLDIEALVTDPRVLEADYRGPVWEIVAETEERLVMLPLRVGSVGEAVKLRRPAVDLRGGRFVGFALFDSTDARRGGTMRRGRAASLEAFASGDGRQLDALLDQQAGRAGTAEAGDRPARDDDAESVSPLASLPEGAPMLTRELTVLPERGLSYELDRAMPGATLRSGDAGYLLVIERERMEAKEPERPIRPDRPDNQTREQRKAASDRYREALDRYREESTAYRELRQQLLNLPTTFEVQGLERVYAVYRIPERLTQAELEGPAPLPWSIDFEAWAGLRSFAQSSQRGSTDEGSLAVVSRVANRPHVMDQRVAAWSIVGSGALDAASRGSDAAGQAAVVDMAKRLVKSGDARAATLLAVEAASIAPPTPASAAVLAAAAKSDVEVLRKRASALALASLRAQLRVDATGDTATEQAIGTAVAALRDPQGPPVELIFEALLDVIESDANQGRGRGHEPVQPSWVEAMQLTGLSETRQHDAVLAVIRRAPVSGLAAAWLDGSVLESREPALVRDALDTLAGARVVLPQAPEPVDEPAAAPPPVPQPQPRVDPLTGEPLGSSAGPVDAQDTASPQGDAVGAASSSVDTGETADPAGPAKPNVTPAPEAKPAPAATSPESESKSGSGSGLILEGFIPVLSEDPPLIRLLESREDWGRTLAWRALSVYEVRAGQRGSGGLGGGAGAVLANRVSSLGLKQAPVPASLVPFLIRLGQGERVDPGTLEAVTLALVRVTMAEDPQAARDAAVALRGGAGPLSTVLAQASPADRQRFAERLYALDTGRAAPMTGIAAAGEPIGERVARWLGDAVAGSAELPGARGWAEAAGGTSGLLDLVAGQNDAASRGALAVLVQQAGGDARDRDRIRQALDNAGPQDAAAIAALWDKQRRTVLKRRVDRASGDYRLAVTHQPAPRPDGTPGQAAQRVDVGVLRLTLEKDKVSLGLDALKVDLMTEPGLALRLPEAGQIQNAGTAGLASLPWAELRGPVDLIPQADGSWQGHADLSRGGRLVFELDPA